MKMGIRRHLPFTSTLAFFGLAVSSTTGCGALSAAGNPGAMWAINDPASLPVVVRRADAAELTTVEVNRLLTATPTGKDSDWTLNVAPDAKVAASDLKALTQDPDYAKTRARVVAAEVWIRTLPSVQSAGGEHPNLLAAIDPGLADSYAAIVAKQSEMAALDVQIDAEKAAGDAKDASAADKKAHADAAAALSKQQADDDAQIEPMQKAFITSVKDAAAKVSPEDQKRFAPAVSILLSALADADISNSAAAIKYPIVIKTLPDAIKTVVPTIAGDVIEEQTGARPSLANLKVKIDLNGTNVTVGVDGLGDLGALSVADATSEIVKRSIKWAGHAVTLLGTVSSTKHAINFERDVLNQLAAAWAPAAGASVVVFKMPAFDSPQVLSATPAVNVSLASMAHAKTVGVASSVTVTGAVVPTGIGAGGGLPNGKGAAVAGKGPAGKGGAAKAGAAAANKAGSTGSAAKKTDSKAAPPAPAKKSDAKDPKKDDKK